jgi:predicted O-methyltransferase YrrM
MDASLIFFRVTGYLKYLTFSRNRKGHGIHSPFVFDLVSRVFRNKNDPGGLSVIENIRRELKKDKRIIELNDLGAGSGNEGDKFRKVSDIAVTSSVPEKYGIFLSNMAFEFAGTMIVEFGTSFGISAMYMAFNCSGASLFTMEGSPAVAVIAKDNFRKAGLTNIKVLTGSFEEKLPEIISMGISPGLVYIDGDHRKKPLLEYFEQIVKIADAKTVVIIDDINYSIEMHEAWCLIRKHEKVSFTIDIYRMGIVFFRSGTGRNSYMIRY